MYQFQTFDGEHYKTHFSPKQIKGFQCFDALHELKESCVVLTKDVDFSTFEYIEL